MKGTTILLKLFPYIVAFLCGLAIVIFVLMQVSAIGWYAILTALIVSALLIWSAALVESRTDARISRGEIKTLEERLQSVEDDVDEWRRNGIRKCEYDLWGEQRNKRQNK